MRNFARLKQSVFTARNVAVCAAAVGLLAVIYLAFADPTTHPAPRCWFNAFTGLQCPGCGSQRAIHALAHLRVADAWHFNPAIFVAVPLAALYAASPRRIERWLYHPATLLTIAAAILIFTILRNLI